MTLLSPPVLPIRARTADQHRLSATLNVPQVRFRALQRQKAIDALDQPNNHLGPSDHAEVSTLLIKLHALETQNLTLRSRCAHLERELSRIAQNIGGSPSALRPPRPALHRCQPRPGDMPAPLRFSSRNSSRRTGQPSSRVHNASDRSLQRSEENSISDLLESYMSFGSSTQVNGEASQRHWSPTSPNFSRPIPMR